MLPNTFINFISFVKSSEGITMMRKEYKTKSNYEQMRNDHFSFIPRNRSNIFEILKLIRYKPRLYIRFKTGYWYSYKIEKFRLKDFQFTNFSHCKYFISFTTSFPYSICHSNFSNITMFFLQTHDSFCWTWGTSRLQTGRIWHKLNLLFLNPWRN